MQLPTPVLSPAVLLVNRYRPTLLTALGSDLAQLVTSASDADRKGVRTLAQERRAEYARVLAAWEDVKSYTDAAPVIERHWPVYLAAVVRFEAVTHVAAHSGPATSPTYDGARRSYLGWVGIASELAELKAAFTAIRNATTLADKDL